MNPSARDSSRRSFVLVKFVARLLAVLALVGSAMPLSAQTDAAKVRHAPSINGSVQGSVQQMLAESVTFNSGANVTANLYVIGSPLVQLNGSPTYGGTQDGTGAVTPSNYTITLNSAASLGHVVRRTNAATWPTVATVPSPSTTASVNVTASSQSVNWSTTRNVTLNSGVGQFVVPAGTYGDFTANNNSGFTLGVAGATTPAVYNFQNLTLNSISKLIVVGPVTINLANGLSANSTVGDSGHPVWLTLNIRSGGYTLNGGCNTYGYVSAPSGTVIINNGTQLVGGVTSDYLTVNSGGLLKLQAATSPNQSPTVTLTAPASGTTYTAPATIALAATATDPDGTISKVEFYSGTTKLGEDASAPYTLSLTNVTAGTYTYFARATDNSSATADSATVTVTVTNPNQPPTITLTAPASGTSFTAPASVTVSATAADPDGTIARVDFYRNGTLFASDTSAPYQVTAGPLAAGSHAFSATAVDNAGATASSATATITVLNPNQAPTVSITAPADGTTYDNPAAFTLSATAADADGSVSKVEFFKDGTKIGEALTAPYQFSVTGLTIGTYHFLARATDNLGSSTDSIAVEISVIHINHAPVALGQSPSTPEDTQLPIILQGTDSDGDPLNFTVVTGPSHGSFSGTAPNLVYTPVPNYNGSDSFTFRVSDGSLQSGLVTVVITVVPVNDAPVADAKSVALDEDTFANIELTGSDIDSSSLTFTYTQPAHGVVSGAAPHVVYTPAANYNGPDSFTYQASDGAANSLPATVTLTVRPVNDAPVALPASVTATENGSTTITLAGTDIDGDTLTYTVVAGPAHGSLSGNGPNRVYTPVSGYYGTDTFTFQVTDTHGASATATITVNVTSLPNHPPTANAQSPTTPEDTPLPVTLTGSDPENDTLVFTIVTQPTQGTLAPGANSALWIYTPAPNYHGGDSFTFKVSDGVFESEPVAVSLTITPVNDAPVAVAQALTTAQDTALAVQLAGTDVDNDPLGFALGTLAAHGTVSLNGSVATYTPASGFYGSDSFFFMATDGTLASVPVEISITVSRQISPPTITSVPVTQVRLPSGRTNENSANFTPFDLTPADLGSSQSDRFSVLPTTNPALFRLTGADVRKINFDTTPSGTPIPSETALTDQYSNLGVLMNGIRVSNNVYGGPASAPNATTSPFTPGLRLEFTFTVPVVAVGVINTSPDQNLLEYYSPDGRRLFQTRDQDAQPGPNYNVDRFVGARVNDGNLIGKIVLVNTTGQIELDEMIFEVLSEQTLPGQFSYQVVATDPQSLPITYSLTAAPVGMVINATSGLIKWLPTTADIGDVPVTVRATNSAGYFDTQSFVLHVVANHSPVANDGAFAVPKNGTRTILLTGSDPDGDPLVFSLGQAPAHGTVSLTGSQAAYTPATGYSGPDAFTFKVNDGLADSAAGAISLTVVNVAPVANNQDVLAVEDTPLPITLTGTDVEGDALTFTVTTQPTHGTLSGTAPNLTYTPATDFSGQDFFTFQVNDGIASSADATVTLHVAPVNDRPVANPQTLDAHQDMTSSVVLSGSDVDGDTLTYSILTQPAHGTLTGTGANRTYTPAAGYLGADSFSYVANDGTIDSLPAVVTISVTEMNYPPVVDAGPDQLIGRPGESTNQVLLQGTATDDGKPSVPGVLTHVWTQVSGPQPAVIDTPNDLATVVHFGPISQGYALHFTNAEDSVALQPISAYYAATAFSWEAWFRGENLPTSASNVLNNGQTLICVADIASGEDIYLGFGSPFSPSRSLSFMVDSPGVQDTTPVSYYPEGGFANNTWYHVVGTQDYVNHRTRLYVNGVLRDSKVSTSSPFGRGMPMSFGRWWDGGNLFNHFQGSMDEVRIYNRELTAEEVTTHFANGLGQPGAVEPGLAGGWHFDEALGGKVVDYSGTKRDGTFTGAPTWVPGFVAGSATIGAPGTYKFRLTANDSALSASDEMTVLVNTAPKVYAGPDAVLMNATQTANLAGVVLDDNVPSGAPIVSWRQMDGPGTANFGNPAAAATTVSFTAPGIYVLEISATDGLFTGTDTVVVRVGIPGVEPASGLAAWWPANGEPHEVIRGNHDAAFIPRGVHYGAGRVSLGFLLDGTYDQGRVEAHSDLDIGASAAGLTVELWARPTSARDVPLVQWESSSSTGVSLRQWYDGRGLYGFLTDSNGTAHEFGVQGTQVPVDTWTHVALTYDKTTGIARLFRNGVVILEQNLGIFTPQTALPLLFGASVREGRLFQGALDEIALYARPLAITEIQAIYQAGAAGRNPVDDNTPPVVNAGPDVQLGSVGNVATLAGTVIDDGHPQGGALSVNWSKVQGPGDVHFADAAAATTTVTFTAPGTYQLQLNASDGAKPALPDTVEVRVGVHGADSGPGLAAWWPANGDVHEIVNGNHDVEFFPKGPSYAAGEVLQAFQLDGGDQGRVAAHADLNIGASSAGLTIELWARPTAQKDTPLVQWETSSTTGLSLRQWYDGRGLYGFLDDTTGAPHEIGVQGDMVSVNTWNHVALTYDKTTGVARLFRNGVIVAEKNLGIFTPQTTLPMLFGASARENKSFQGALDEIAIYTRPLSVPEIQAIYQAGIAGKSPLDGNAAPLTNAGADVQVPGISDAAMLSGTVSDDGLPAGGPLTSLWSKVTGPGGVNFADATAAHTTATFTAPGLYLLRLDASDGLKQALGDTVVVHVGTSGVEVAPGLAAWWPANGDVHEVVNGNHDVEFFPKGAIYGAGEVAQAFQLDGGDQGRVAAHADLDIGASAAGLTIELWARPTAQRDTPLVQWETSSTTGLSLRQWYDGRGLYGFLDDTTGAPHEIGVQGDMVSVNTWNHVALTYDKTTGLARLFRNGVIVAEKPLGIFTPQTTLPLLFGASVRENRFYQGALDEVAVYTRPLAPSEIQAIYQAGSSGRNLINQPPVANAGPDRSTVIGAMLSLSGSASDDGLPNPPAALSYLWTQASGPGTAVFASANAAATTVTFDTAGTYVLRLTANDSSRSATDNVTVTVSASLPPEVALTSPLPGDILVANSATTLTATATDPDGTVTKVEFFDGTTKLGEDSTAPCSLTLATGFTAGVHTLTAKATDNTGQTTTSAAVTIASAVSASQPPAISISEPTNGAARLANTGFQIVATATDSDGTIAKVEFFRGSTKLGEQAFAQPGHPTTYSWVINGGLPAGSYSLTAKATDNSGTSTTSAPIAITVLSSLPPSPVLKLSAPLAGAEISASTDLIGTASGTALRSYAVQVRYQTPANNTPWKTVATGTSSVTDGVLGQFDPTLLRNGLYEIRLTAIDQFDRTYEESAPYQWVSVVGGMKIGTNTSTSTDLVVPAPGRPLTVVRHYDSTNSRMGDFGLGTSLGNQDYTIQLSSTTQRADGSGAPSALGADWFAYTVMSGGFFSVPLFVVDPAPPFDATGLPPEPRIVAITLPDNTTFRFAARLTPNRLIGEISAGQIVFDPLPGTVGQLEALNEATLEVDNQVLSESNSGFTNLIRYGDGAPLNPGAYRLTALDGTQYFISTTKGVLKVTDRNGNATTYSPNRIASSNGPAIDLVRDAAGRITAVKDPSGQSLQYAYDTTGRLITVTDREGRTTTYGYLEGTSLVTSIQKPGAILPEYDAYDAVSRLASKIGGALANGGTVTERDLANKREKHRDALNRVTTAEYDEFGNIVKQTNALGFSTIYGFTDSRFRDKATLFTDAEGHSTFYHYNAQGLVDTVTDANGHATSYTYNANGQILTETNALGHATIQTYDTAGNLLTRTDREGHTTSCTYDATGNVLTEHSPLGNETRYTYNPLGQPLTEGEFAPDGTPGRSRSYTYDANGNLASETTYQLNAQGVPVPVTTRYEYDLNAQPTKTIYPDGTFTTKTYSSSGLLATETDRAGAVVNYTYDDAGRATRTTYADGSYEEKTYDAVGRVTTERNVLGQIATNAYDDGDRLLSVDLPGIGTQIRTYDKVGRMLTESDEGGRITGTTYDPAGNITKITHPDGTSTDLGYDAADNLLTASARVFFDGPTSGGFGYNSVRADIGVDAPIQIASNRHTLPNGLQITPASFALRKSGQHSSRRLIAQATPPPSTPTSRQYVYAYDANGRVTKITNPDNSFSSLVYDAFGRPTSTTNEEGKTWSYEYDPKSSSPARRTKVAGPVGSGYSENYLYDEFDNIKFMIDAVGCVTTYSYNAANQPTFIKYAGMDGGFTSETYDYDDKGRLIHLRDREGNDTTFDDQRSANSKAGSRRITRSVGGVAYLTVETYDAAGNLITVVDPHDAITTNTYDYFNRRISTQLPDGTKIKTLYGPGNRVDQTDEIASDGTTRTTTHLYDDNNHLTQTTRPDGSVIDYAFHADGRLHRISQPHFSGAPVNTTEITYDDVNRFTQITDAASRSTYRKHDKLGRLTDESDTAGTRTHRDYDDLNRVTFITLAAGTPKALTTGMTYDALGNLHTQTEAYGTAEARTTTYVYEILGSGTRITTTYADNTTSQTSLDTRGLVTSSITPRGNATTTVYDALGRPTLVHAPLGQNLTYTYPNFGESQVATDALGRTMTRKFDQSQRLTDEILPGNFGTRTYSYDGFGQLRTARNTRGLAYTTTMEYDSMGRTTKVTRPDATFNSTTYTAWGEPEIVRDARNVATRYFYDPSLNRLTDVTVAYGDPKARTTSYAYDSANRINKITAPNGQVIDSLFNVRGQLETRSTKLETAAAAPTYNEAFAYYETGELKKHTDVRGDTVYVYDPLGRPKSVTDALSQTTSTEYDHDGNPETITDALNRVTTRTYDALGRIKTVLYPQGATETNDYDAYHLTQRTLAPTSGGGVPVVTEFGYDVLDRVTTTTQHNTSGNVIESRTYDGEGNLLTATDPDHRITSYHYDLVGLVDLITHPDASTESFTYDGQGNRRTHSFAPLTDNRTYTYTPFGELESVTDDLNHTTTYTYDDAGNRRTATDPKSRVTAYQYDLASRLRVLTQPGNRVSTFDYDVVGNRVAITDAANRTHRFEYDSLGRLTRALTPLNSSSSGLGANQADPYGSVVNIAGQNFAASQLTYDPVGNLETLTDANNHLTRFKYDAGNRLTHTYLPKNPASPHEINTYDFAGRRTTSADADGATTTYAYDQVGRLTGVVPPASRPGAPVAYAYYPSGLRQTMTDGLGTSSYTYDSRGRLNTEQTPYAGRLTYTHDTLGRLKNLQSNNLGGVNTTYGYDNASRLTSVTDVLHGESTAYDYNDADQLTGVTQPNGTSTTQTYDAAGRPDITTTLRGSTPLLVQQYTYTPADQVATRSLSMARPGALPALQHATAYSYDDSDRLLREVHTGDTATGQIDYTLDPAGNRMARSSSVVGIGNQSFTYDANNGLISLFSYDSRGNPVSGPLSPGSFTDSYDYLNHQADRTGKVEYIYDGDGRRVGHRSFDFVSGRWTTHTRLISSLNPTGYDQDVEEYTDGVLSASYTLGRERLAGLRYVDEATTANGLTIALGSDGKVYAWGNGQSTPTLVSGLTNIIAVGAGASHYLALGADGKVYTWGVDNSFGQLGRAGSAGTPTAIPGLTDISAISTQLNHTLALAANGTVYAWGDNSSGQLGDGSTTSQAAPVQVMSGAVAIAAGQAHSYALALGGQVLSWGDNTYGQLGRAGTAPTLTPTSVSGLANVEELAAGAFHTLALKTDGSLVTWGDNTYGQLGEPAVISQSATPTTLTSVSGLASIAAGARHSLAIRSDGTLLAWGDNHAGQLGVAYPDNLFSPTVVPGLGNLAHLSAGARSTYATTAAGATYVMGENRTGQLGTGNTARATTPVLLPPGTNPAFAAIASGGESGVSRTAHSAGLHDQYFAPDVHGHTHLLTDLNGLQSQAYSYDAFGDLIEATTRTGASLLGSGAANIAEVNPYLYRGERLEGDTGRYHLRARDYDANLGRLATLDSVVGDPSEPMTLNRYGYANANPVGVADPSGHFGISVWEVINAMDEINSQWDQIKAVGPNEEFDPEQALSGFTMAVSGFPAPGLIVTKKERSVWVNPSRGGGMIGSLVGESAQGYNALKKANEGFSADSDVFFHANSAPRHRLSMVERTVEQSWVSAYNLRHTFNTGLPASSPDPKAWQTRWPAHLYHDALLQAQIRGQLIDGPVEARFTHSMERKLYNRARTALTATAGKNLNAAQSGGLLDWQAPARPGADATFIQSIHATGFAGPSQFELFASELKGHEQYWSITKSSDMYRNGYGKAFNEAARGLRALDQYDDSSYGLFVREYFATALEGVGSGLSPQGMEHTYKEGEAHFENAFTAYSEYKFVSGTLHLGGGALSAVSLGMTLSPLASAEKGLGRILESSVSALTENTAVSLRTSVVAAAEQRARILSNIAESRAARQNAGSGLSIMEARAAQAVEAEALPLQLQLEQQQMQVLERVPLPGDTDFIGPMRRGVAPVLEYSSKKEAAQLFEDAVSGAASDISSRKRIVPGLFFDNPNLRGRNLVRFDGIEGTRLIDRKFNVTTKTKQIGDLQRMSKALRQNPEFQGVIQVPNEAARKAAISALRKADVSNITVEIVH